MQYVLDILKKNTYLQFMQFALVGGLNTAVDFAVLNALTYAFGTGQNGILYIYFKAISFVAAVINSYLFNKFWVFKETAAKNSKTEGPLFAAVSCIGFLINIAVASTIFLIFSHTNLGLMHPSLASNLGAIAGTAVVLLFNFIGYKYFVFRSEKNF